MTDKKRKVADRIYEVTDRKRKVMDRIFKVMDRICEVMDRINEVTDKDRKQSIDGLRQKAVRLIGE
ncbi:hypothetical protein ACMGD3_02950 [Lysinibacillus sphaericus]|uniref:hypothetical protein n=1 Tax=Lysinibacillus sphaericus TaxID=1421 RepID=UPI003F7A6983